MKKNIMSIYMKSWENGIIFMMRMIVQWCYWRWWKHHLIIVVAGGWWACWSHFVLIGAVNHWLLGGFRAILMSLLWAPFNNGRITYLRVGLSWNIHKEAKLVAAMEKGGKLMVNWEVYFFFSNAGGGYLGQVLLGMCLSEPPPHYSLFCGQL